MRLSLVVCVCVYRYCLGVCLCKWLRNDQCVCKFPVCALISTCVCVCWNLWCVFVFCRWGLRGQQLPFTSAALTRYGFPHGSENTDVMYERMSATPPGVTQETDMKLKSIRPADSFSLLFLSLSLSPRLFPIDLTLHRPLHRSPRLVFIRVAPSYLTFVFLSLNFCSSFFPLSSPATFSSSHFLSSCKHTS